MSADVLLVEREVWLHDGAQRTKHLILRLYVPTPADIDFECRFLYMCDEHATDRRVSGVDPWQSLFIAIAMLKLEVELELRDGFSLYWFKEDVGERERALSLTTLFDELEPA